MTAASMSGGYAVVFASLLVATLCPTFAQGPSGPFPADAQRARLAAWAAKLQSSSEVERTEAARFLAYYRSYGADVQDQLTKCVSNGRFSIDLRAECGKALAEQGTLAAPAAPAAAELTRQPDARLREMGATLLNAIGLAASPQTDALLRLLGDAEPGPRYEAGRALAHIGRAALEQTLPLLRSDNADTRDGAIFALGEGGKEAPAGVGALLASSVLLGTEDDASSALGALEKLGPLAADAVPDLLNALDIRSPALKPKIVSALGYIHERADIAVPALRKALADPSGGVRSQAAHALSRYGQDAGPAFDDLARVLLKDDEVDVRSLSVEALVAADSKSDRARNLLVEALKDDWPTTRMVAAQSLSEFGAPAVPALVEQLDAADANVRQAAAEALWKIGAPQNLPAFRKLVDLWLADLGPVRVAAGNGLRTMSRRALDALPDLLLDLSHPDRDRRRDTGRLLGDIFATSARDVRDLADADLDRETDAIRNASSVVRASLDDDAVVEQIETSLARYAGERDRRNAAIAASRLRIFGWIAAALVILALLWLVSGAFRQSLLRAVGGKWAFVSGDPDDVFSVTGSKQTAHIVHRTSSPVVDEITFSPGAAPGLVPSELVEVSGRLQRHTASIIVDRALFGIAWQPLLGSNWAQATNAFVAGQAVRGKLETALRPRRRVTFGAIGFSGRGSAGSLFGVDLEIRSATRVFKRWGADLFPNDAHAGNALASPSDLSDALRSCDIVHVAAHGSPSALYLREGTFTATDVPTGENLRTRLAVLSACDTQFSGEEDASIVWTLVSGGCSVIATRRPVDDQTCRWFFEALYSDLLPGRRAAGRELSLSIRAAADNVLTRVNKLTDHAARERGIQSLAAFVLYGDPTMQLKLTFRTPQ